VSPALILPLTLPPLSVIAKRLPLILPLMLPPLSVITKIYSHKHE